MDIKNADQKIITYMRRWRMPAARIAIFVLYFYFGLLKLLDLSPASPLAEALVAQTIGAARFEAAFKILAFYECVIGILFLIPKATRIVIPLLLIHVVIVCSPLVLVPDLVWTQALVPTLEGQYIIKNIAIVALALGIAAQTKPMKQR